MRAGRSVPPAFPCAPSLQRVGAVFPTHLRCVVLQLLENRALPLLIGLISSHDSVVQELAAAVVNNVRRSVQQDTRL